MNTINPELVVSEKKLKTASRRLKDVLAKAGVQSDLNYAQSLNVISKTLFGISYEEIRATLFDNSTGSKKDNFTPPSVYLVKVGGNTLLVVDGVYDGATNPGTDMEISEKTLYSMASRVAERLGVALQEYAMPDAISCLDLDSDDQYVDIMREMGFFRPEGSLFKHLIDADVITIDGMSIESASFMEEDSFEDAGVEPHHIVWDPVCSYPGDIEQHDLTFTFDELCNAKKVNGDWHVYSKDLHDTVIVSIFKKA